MAGGLQAEVTTLLDEIRAGKAEAKSQLVELVYAELHALARQAWIRRRRNRDDSGRQYFTGVARGLVEMSGRIAPV